MVRSILLGNKERKQEATLKMSTKQYEEEFTDKKNKCIEEIRKPIVYCYSVIKFTKSKRYK